MYYIKLYDFIVRNDLLTWSEKIVFSQLYCIWEEKGRNTIEDYGFIEIKTSYLIKDLGIDKRQYYRILDNLESYHYIEKIGMPSKKSTLFRLYFGVDEYLETAKILKELREKWKKHKVESNNK